MSDLSQEDIAWLNELILSGQKIEAIKVHKELTGSGLRESKSYIDVLEDRLREENTGFSPNANQTTRHSRLSIGNIPEEDAKKMTELIFTGRKLPAIKMYRAATGIGLKESKDFIDALEKQLREECPENFTHAAGRGCSVVLAAGVLLVMAAAAGWT